MKFNIQNRLSKFFSHLFWTYLTLVALHHFGQPFILSTEAASVGGSSPSPPALAGRKLQSAVVTTAPYVRKSRDTNGLSPTSSPEFINGQDQFGDFPSQGLSAHSGGGGGYFQYPSFKHKYQPRVSRFHAEGPATRSYSIRSMSSFPKLNPLAGILSMKTELKNPLMEELSDGENQDQDPTFTPYISARAFQLPQFFQHLRDNIEALQLDEDGQGDEDSIDFDKLLGLGQPEDPLFPYGSDDESRLTVQRPPEKPMRWMPATAGMTGRSHIRHFVQDPAEHDLFYKKPQYPARNAYEFGLG